MNKISLASGKLLEIVYNNSQSIRGVQDPHIVSFSKLIFSEIDVDSFHALQKFYKNSNLDSINIFYCLAIFLLEDKIHSKIINFEETVNSTKFIDNNFKLILLELNSFRSNPNIKSLQKIQSYSIDNEYISLIVALSFFKIDIDINESFIFFPDVYDYFVIKDGLLVPANNNSIIKFIKDKGLFSIFYFCKYYNFLSNKNYEIFLDSFIKSKVFNGFILHLYFIKFYKTGNFINNFLNNFHKYLSLMPSHFIMSISQFILLNYLVSNDFSYINNWYNQFSDSIKKNLLIKDFDNNFDWAINNNDFEPVLYRPHQLNSRFYINAIYNLASSRNQNPDFYNNLNNGFKINVFGGLQALSFSNLKFNNSYIDIIFQYNDKFSNNESLFAISKDDIKILNDISNKNIIIFDFEHFKHLDSKDFILSFFKKIENVKNKKNIYFCSTLLPSISSHRYLDSFKVRDKIELFNIELENQVIESNFKFIDTNNFIEIDGGFLSSRDLLCDYFIKPDIIYNIIKQKIM